MALFYRGVDHPDMDIALHLFFFFFSIRQIKGIEKYQTKPRAQFDKFS